MLPVQLNLEELRKIFFNDENELIIIDIYVYMIIDIFHDNLCSQKAMHVM